MGMNFSWNFPDLSGPFVNYPNNVAEVNSEGKC